MDRASMWKEKKYTRFRCFADANKVFVEMEIRNYLRLADVHRLGPFPSGQTSVWHNLPAHLVEMVSVNREVDSEWLWKIDLCCYSWRWVPLSQADARWQGMMHKQLACAAYLLWRQINGLFSTLVSLMFFTSTSEGDQEKKEKNTVKEMCVCICVVPGLPWRLSHYG